MQLELKFSDMLWVACVRQRCDFNDFNLIITYTLHGWMHGT